jgi:hypothetical protein
LSVADAHRLDKLEESKRVLILKSTGLGISDLMLRRMAWLALVSDKYQGSQFCIITGPNIDLAIGLIKRLKDLFLPKLNITFDSDRTTIVLDQCTIRAFPSHHLDAMRSLTSPKLILVDECDFLPPAESLKIRGVVERYIAKSDPEIALVSTPGQIGGLFQKILQEPENECIYSRLVLPYQVGENKIYSVAEIQEAKRSAAFAIEYECKFLGGGGSIFREDSIQAAMDKGRSISTKPIATSRSIGLDPGFGSSPYGVVITEIRDSYINVVYANEFERPNYNEMVRKVVKLTQLFDIRFQNGGRIYVDSANADVMGTLKETFYENTRYDQEIAHYKSLFKSEYDLEVLQNNMFIIPVPFRQYHREMLAHLKGLLEYQDGVVAIHPRHEKVITSLRTAIEKGDGSLDKESTRYDNVFDALRLSAFRWQLKRAPKIVRRSSFGITETRAW